jgi:hypothetical protein
MQENVLHQVDHKSKCEFSAFGFTFSSRYIDCGGCICLLLLAEALDCAWKPLQENPGPLNELSLEYVKGGSSLNVTEFRRLKR